MTAIASVIAFSASASEPEPAPETRLLVVNDGGAVDTLDAWRAIVCEEFAVVGDINGVDSTAAHPVGPRVAISAMASDGAVVPLGDLSYMFPRAGLYVLRNGQVIRANPLGLSTLERSHRLIDLDHRGLVLRRPDETDAGGAPIPMRTALRVGAECRTLRSVLGRSTEEFSLIPLAGAELVVFDPGALPHAMTDLEKVRAGAPIVNRGAMESGSPEAKSDRARNRI